MTYYHFGQRLIAEHPHSRTICGTLEDGRKAWIKRPAHTKTRFWHRLQSLLAAILRKPILRATVSQGGSRGLWLEADRLTALKEAGFYVPEIYGAHDDMLILSDGGIELHRHLNKIDDPLVRQDILTRAVRALAALHRAGLAHGRPYIRDLIAREENGELTIGFIDLEENPALVMPLPAAQARDLWIFLSSASRFTLNKANKSIYNRSLIGDLYAAYESERADPKTIKELHDLIDLLSPLLPLLQSAFLWPKIGTDARQATIATQALRDAFALDDKG